jgi:hypothetical protein
MLMRLPKFGIGGHHVSNRSGVLRRKRAYKSDYQQATYSHPNLAPSPFSKRC